MDTATTMEINAVTPEIALVVLTGRLDIAGAQKIDLPFNTLPSAYRSVIVDMTGVTFLASIGIRTLLLCAKTLQRRGGTFVLLSPQPEVEEVLTVTGVGELMPVVRNLDAARAAVVP